MTNNILLSDNAYISEDIKKPQKIISKLNRGKIVKTYFFVCFVNDDKRLQIFNSRLFLLKTYSSSICKVYGLFTDENDAFEYIRVLTEISMDKYQDIDFNSLLVDLEPDEVNKRFYEEKK